MSVLRHEVRPGAYADSIVLMRVQSGLAALDGVEDAGVVMATTANLEILAESGLLPAGLDPAADDLLIVVRAATEAAGDAALSSIDELFSRRAADGDDEFRPRSLRSALSLAPAAPWVLISVPGRYAARVAEEAIAADRNVFLYSDNVSLDDELRLKRLATEKGLLMMGPDCGTAIVGGAGFGFANRVERGAIGLVGASGTGLQAITTRLESLGVGVSQALGTGGRDLSGEVGGLTASAALAALSADAETEVVVLVSKPPAPEVSARMLERAATIGKPVVVYFQGLAAPVTPLGNLHFARSLDEAASLAVAALDADTDPASEGPSWSGTLSGLFAGGTLAMEMAQSLLPWLAPLSTNLGVGDLPESTEAAHSVLDLGADELTVGRLHPMIDQDLRLRYLARAGADPAVGAIVLDLVLGDGAHPDPAAELAPLVEELLAARPELLVVAVVVGAQDDPQEPEVQRERLAAAGAVVASSVADATRILWSGRRGVLEGVAPAVRAECLAAPVSAINVGLESFHDSLLEQGAKSTQVDWRPPAGGDERLMAILERMRA